MNENDNFEALRRLLALKRHEVPPPGYFNRFSGEVIARIRAGEQDAGSTAESIFARAPWLLRFLQMFEAKPAFASSFASALCLLLLFGIVYAEQSDRSSQSLLQATELSPGLSQAGITPMADARNTDLYSASISNSPAPSLQPMFNHALVQPVSFSYSTP
jgi:hypothetical protein